MAFFVTGSPMIVQLHCNGPTGKVSRMRVGCWDIGGLLDKRGRAIFAQLSIQPMAATSNVKNP
jgi:hypothetical protein